MKKALKYLLVVILILAINTYFMNRQEYHYPPNEKLTRQINYLERIIKEPFDNKSELYHMQDLSGEWMLFSLSFTAFGLTNICFHDSTFKERAIPIIDEAIQKAMNPVVYNFYGGSTDPLNPINSNFSVLYFGHLNLMMSCYRLLSDDQKYDSLNDSLSKSLYDRFRNSKTMCLESYGRSIWIPDNTVALASIKLNGDKNHNPEYEKLCSDWINYAKNNYTDKNTNVLCSTIDFDNGKITEQPRGAMLGWSILFISLFNMNYANELFINYKNHFSNDVLMFELYKERAGNFETGKGDIDSVPLILGYSIPANAWAFGCAVLFNDLKSARKLERLVNFGSKEMDDGKEIKYGIRFTDFSVSPLNDALLLYLSTMTEWK